MLFVTCMITWSQTHQPSVNKLSNSAFLLITLGMTVCVLRMNKMCMCTIIKAVLFASTLWGQKCYTFCVINIFAPWCNLFLSLYILPLIQTDKYHDCCANWVLKKILLSLDLWGRWVFEKKQLDTVRSITQNGYFMASQDFLWRKEKALLREMCYFQVLTKEN